MLTDFVDLALDVTALRVHRLRWTDALRKEQQGFLLQIDDSRQSQQVFVLALAFSLIFCVAW